MQTQHQYDKPGDASISNSLTPQEARSIAKEAYIYAFPSRLLIFATSSSRAPGAKPRLCW
jgi:hypothetical protein